MNKKKISKVLITILVLMMVLPSGYAVYSLISDQISNSDQQSTSTLQVEASPDYGNMEISAEIQDIIRQQDPDNFDRNMTNYRNLLAKLNVHIKFKDEIERLIKGGHKLPNILVAYEFLNDSFGKMQDIEVLVKEKESGKSWTTVFQVYNSNNPEFVPGSFETGYLEELMKTPGITSDDVMIGDRVSQKVAKTFKEIIEIRINGMSWKDINAAVDIVNGSDKFPHIPVTPDQIKKYRQGGLSEEKVIDALITAYKMEKGTDEIISKVKSGYTKERIYDEYYTQKYY